jgi:hypothetical protein
VEHRILRPTLVRITNLGTGDSEFQTDPVEDPEVLSLPSPSLAVGEIFAGLFDADRWATAVSRA